MIWVIIGGSVMLILAVVEGSRRLPTVMPVAGSCSAAIAAACHPVKVENLDPDDVYRPVQWGAMNAGKDLAHFGFSAGEVGATIGPAVQQNGYK